MKKIIKLTETELVKMCSLIIERIDNYSHGDLVDGYLQLFKGWISSKFGDKFENYPISFLLNNYGKEFEKYLGYKRDGEDEEDDEDSYYDDDDDDNGYDLDYWLVKDIMAQAVKSGKYTLPSLNTGVKFTEKNKKKFQYLLSGLRLPDYIKLKFNEESPNEINMNIDVDYVKMITTNEENPIRISRSALEKKVKEYLKNYLGVEFGNPIHGKIRFESSEVNYIGFEEWKKNVFTKSLRKDIKNGHTIGGYLKSVKLTLLKTGMTNIEFNFPYSSKINNLTEFKEYVIDYLKDNGYNPERFEIQIRTIY